MSLEWLSADRLNLVTGRLELVDLAFRHEPPPTRVTVLRDPALGERVFAVLAEPELEELLERIRGLRGPPESDWLRHELVSSVKAAASAERSQPNEPTVVIAKGGLTGAWLPERMATGPPSPAPPPRRGRLRSGTQRRARRRVRRPGGREPTMRNGDPGRPSTPATGPTGEPAIRRTPHLDAPETIPTAAGGTFEIAILVGTGPAMPEEVSDEVVIEAPPEVTAISVGVLVTTSAHFAVDSAPYLPLTIEREREESERIAFQLHVVEGAPAGIAQVFALFVYNGRSCGHVARAWRWDPDEEYAPAIRPEASQAATVPVHVDTEQPDLTVIIENPVNDGVHFTCAVITTRIDGYAEPQPVDWALPERAEDFVRTRLSEFTDPDISADERRVALISAGHEFYDAAPQAFKDVLWNMVDAPGDLRPRHIYVATAEPTLPWELMIPSKDGRELRPLGVEFPVGRWTRADAASPPQRLQVDSAFVVAPQYPTESRRLNAPNEIALLATRLAGRVLDPENATELDQSFLTERASVLHFVCHGVADEQFDDAIYLRDEKPFAARTLRARDGFKALCQSKRPLVFMNACETGKQVKALSGGAGFPRAFGDIGARAIIAPLWPVDDALADTIAVRIYEAALAPDSPPLAEILRVVRAEAYELLREPGADAEDTYAAYCLFGDPLTRVETSR
jgi:hypothetical protein